MRVFPAPRDEQNSSMRVPKRRTAEIDAAAEGIALLGTTKALTAAAAVVAATLFSVGMDLPDLAAEKTSNAPPRIPAPPILAPVPAGAADDALDALDAAQIARELDAILAVLARGEAPLDATLALRAEAVATAIARLGEDTETATLLDLKTKIHACLALLASVETESESAASLHAALEAALRATVALLGERGVVLGSGVDARSVESLVAELENRLSYANGNPWTLRAVKENAYALLALVADLEAIGAITVDLAGALEERLSVALRVCLSLLAELEIGGDGCPDTCDPPPCASACEPEPCAECAPPCGSACAEPPPPTPTPTCTQDCGGPTEPSPPPPPPPPPACDECPPPCGDCPPPCAPDCDPCPGSCPPPCGCEEGDDALIDVDVRVDVDAVVVVLLGPRGEDASAGCGCDEPEPVSIIGRL